jgi:hypothetical protein
LGGSFCVSFVLGLELFFLWSFFMGFLGMEFIYVENLDYLMMLLNISNGAKIK